MRALYWLLLLLVIIGGCSGTKRKPNAPENTTNAVETDEDTWEEDLATFCSPRRSRRRGSAGPTHGSTRTPAVNASSIPQCKTEFGAGVATDTSKPQPKYGLGAGLGANRNGGKSAKGEPHDEIDKEASESPMSSRPAAKRISGGSQVAGSRSKPCLLILPLGLSHAHSALSPIAHPPSFLLLFLRTRPLTTAGSPRKQSLRKSSPTTTPNTPEKRGLRAGAGQSSGGGKRRKVGKLKKDAQVLVPFLKDEAECGSRSWSQKLWVGKVVASNMTPTHILGSGRTSS